MYETLFHLQPGSLKQYTAVVKSHGSSVAHVHSLAANGYVQFTKE